MKFTSAALNKIASILTDDQEYLRCLVRGGGCAGAEFDFVLTHHIDQFDTLIHKDNARIVIDKKSEIVLADAELDWEGGLMGKRFVMRFPDSRRTCSCGTSFSL